MDEPVLDVNWVFIKRVGDPFDYSGPESLAGKSIAVVRGTGTARALKTHTGFKIHDVNHSEFLLSMVKAGRLDMALYHSVGFQYMIRNENLKKDLVLVKTPYAEKKHYIAFHPGMKDDVIRKINQAVVEMKASGEADQILDKYR